MLPLEGIKVVEIAQNLAGPFCAEILGSMGADVVKIERPDGGDDSRGWGPPFPDGISTGFQVINFNKRSAVLDVKNAEDRDWLEDFIGQNDILIHNMRPGIMEELNLGGERMLKRFPRLIYAEVSGFGATGPMKLSPGYDTIVQALAGFFHLNGDPQSPPSRIGPAVLDLGTGMWAAMGCLAALNKRNVTGKGCIVDTSLLETALSFIAPAIATLSVTGKAPARYRAGIAKIVPFEAFKTADSEILIAAANNKLFAKVAEVVGLPELAKNPRYKTNADRLANKDELLNLLAGRIRTRTSKEWLDAMDAVGIPCSEINTLEQAVNHPQTQALGITEEMTKGGIRLTKLPLQFDRERLPIKRRAPRLGEHTDEIRSNARKKSQA